jgi:hypothetical protein
VLVMLEHSRANDVFIGASLVNRHLNVFLSRMGPDVNSGRVEPEGKRLVAFTVGVHPFECVGEHLGVDGASTPTEVWLHGLPLDGSGAIAEELHAGAATMQRAAA